MMPTNQVDYDHHLTYKGYAIIEAYRGVSSELYVDTWTLNDEFIDKIQFTLTLIENNKFNFDDDICPGP